MNEEIVKKVFPKESERIKKGNCPFCNKEINEEDFKDDLSRKEYKISGLCQSCIDKTFDRH